ncbi:MAG: SIR2 family NAD-dependent protein deacylase [Arcticibacter sp.]
MRKIVVFTGAGMSAESGIKTFRDSGGLWEEHDIKDVATPEAWSRNPDLVTQFYNQRRKQMLESSPNEGHLALARLETKYDVSIITQNVDDLHERAGSSNVMHLHGELSKCGSTADPNLVYDVDGWELTADSKCELGSRLRPHIVWFGEDVPMMIPAIQLTSISDIFIIIGTSLEVYPAAGLATRAPSESIKYYIDPNASSLSNIKNLTIVREKSGVALPQLVDELLSISN